MADNSQYYDRWGRQVRRMPGQSARPSDNVGIALDYRNQVGKEHPYVNVTGPGIDRPNNMAAMGSYFPQSQIPVPVGPGGRMTTDETQAVMRTLRSMNNMQGGTPVQYGQHRNWEFNNPMYDWFNRQDPVTLGRLNELMGSTMGQTPISASPRKTRR